MYKMSFLTSPPLSFTVMDFACLRQYLGDPPRSCPRDVMTDAVVYQNPGARP
jgi:hypothetical protein